MILKKIFIGSFILSILSGILWGIVGLFDFELITCLLGPIWLTDIIYVIFGFSGIFLAVTYQHARKKWFK